MVATIIICIVIAVIMVFSIRYMIQKGKGGCCNAGDEVKPVYPDDRDLSHYPYHYHMAIEGMTCQNCVVRIQNAFHHMDGFYARVNRHQKAAEIYAKQPAETNLLRRTVVGLGYTVGDVTDQTAAQD